MKTELMNLCLFIFICFIIYLFFKKFNFSYKEGMTDASGNATASTANGIAGNAATYAATIKSTTIKLQDTFLISKYQTDYETVILNLDELISNLMLQTALSVNSSNPLSSIVQLSELNQAKTALNSVMKFIDSQ